MAETVRLQNRGKRFSFSGEGGFFKSLGRQRQNHTLRVATFPNDDDSSPSTPTSQRSPKSPKTPRTPSEEKKVLKKGISQSMGKARSRTKEDLYEIPEDAFSDSMLTGRRIVQNSLPASHVHPTEYGISSFCRGSLSYVTAEGSQTHWFVFDDFVLRAFREPDDLDDAIFEIPLLNAKVSELNDDTILVERSSTGTFMLRAENAEERDTWFDVLKQCQGAAPSRTLGRNATSMLFADDSRNILSAELRVHERKAEAVATETGAVSVQQEAKAAMLRDAIIDARRQRKSVLMRENSRRKMLESMRALQEKRAAAAAALGEGGSPGPDDTADDEEVSLVTTPRSPSASPDLSRMLRVDSKELVLQFQKKTDGTYDRLNVLGGSLSMLVEHLADEEVPDRKYADIFLLTYRYLCTATVLLEHLSSRFNVIPPPNAEMHQLVYFETWKPVIQIRTIGIIKRWMEHYWMDFEHDPTARAGLQDFFDMVVEQNPQLAGLIGRLRQRAQSLHEEFEIATENARRAKAREAELKKQKRDRQLEFYILDPIEFAHQLTLVDYEKFAAIHPVEFVCRLWEGNSVKTQYLQDMIEWFNTISYFVATEICVQPEQKKRVRLLENFIRVAVECRRIHNLNATMAILSGLNNSAVRRLQKTWNHVNPKLIEAFMELETLMSDAGNFRAYREFMAALGTSPTSIKTPCIPFLGLLLRDLTFLNDGIPKTLRPKVFSFSKLRRLAEPIFFVQMLKRVPYEFPTTRLSIAMQEYLKVPNAMMEQTVLYSCSLLCEPRHAGDGSPPQQRLIEKWAKQNKNSEEQEKKDLEDWSAKMWQKTLPQRERDRTVKRTDSFLNKEVTTEISIVAVSP